MEGQASKLNVIDPASNKEVSNFKIIVANDSSFFTCPHDEKQIVFWQKPLAILGNGSVLFEDQNGGGISTFDYNCVEGNSKVVAFVCKNNDGVRSECDGNSGACLPKCCPPDQGLQYKTSNLNAKIIMLLTPTTTLQTNSKC